jgi:DeoR/GlpR family transcriptional regulator of sugar metabolism
VAELAMEFDVSPITLCRDVEALARREYVVRGHGVVRLPSSRREAISLLLDRVERGGPVRHVELLPGLVDRGSTRR